MFTKTILLQIFLAAAVPQAVVHRGTVKISGRSAHGQAIGTGICLDTPCAHILTNYHVAVFLGKDAQVEGVPVQVTQLYTGPEDTGAIEIESALGPVKYNPGKDLALMTLRSALPAAFSGLSFALDQPRIGQNVTRSARWGEEYDIARGRVISDQVTHRSLDGALTVLPQHFLLDCSSRAGNSGGAVIDASGQALGMVTMRSTDDEGRGGTIVVSSAIVSDFLKDADHALWSKVFPSRASVALAIEPESWPLGLGHIAAPRQPAPEFAGILRSKARDNAAAMQNMTAVESISTWGQDQSRRSWLYRVAIYDGRQKYQRIPAKGGLASQPFTSEILWPRMTGVVPGEQWSIIPALLADASVEYKGTSTYDGRPAHLFGYSSSATGCASRWLGKKIYAGCSGWVVADAGMNALLITQRMDLPAGDASVIRWTETYRSVSLPGREVLLPSELQMSGEFRTGKTYYASARWSRYQLFVAESRLRFDQALE